MNHVCNAKGLSRLRPYPAYRNSGVAWLRWIPAHWQLLKLGWLTQCLDGRRIPLNSEERSRIQGEYPYWGANCIVDYVDRWLFDEELVLLGEDGAPFFDRNRPVAFRVTGKIWVNNHAHVLRPNRRIETAFLAHVLNCVDYRAFIDGSTRDKLTQSDMRSIPIQCPPLSEQRALAAFLDRETGKIDALVEKNERLIELLQEKRTALITQTVTRGLDPNVPMKDSGVEWLRGIPSHWDVRRLKYLLRAKKGAIKTGPFGSQLQSSDMNGGEVKVYNQRNVIDRNFSLGDNYISLEKFAELGGFETFPGDLLITTRGSIGRCAELPDGAERGILHPCLMRIQADKRKISNRFLEIEIQDSSIVLEQLRLMSNATTIDVIYSESLKEVLLVIPPVAEQNAIAIFLDRETTSIDALVVKIREEIGRLKEYRTALISAAVTGKIDVREEAA